MCIVKITPLAWTFYVRLVRCFKTHAFHFNSIFIKLHFRNIKHTFSFLRSLTLLLSVTHSLTLFLSFCLCLSFYTFLVVFRFVVRRIDCGTLTHSIPLLVAKWPTHKRNHSSRALTLSVIVWMAWTKLISENEQLAVARNERKMVWFYGGALRNEWIIKVSVILCAFLWLMLFSNTHTHKRTHKKSSKWMLNLMHTYFPRSYCKNGTFLLAFYFYRRVRWNLFIFAILLDGIWYGSWCRCRKWLLVQQQNSKKIRSTLFV